MSYITFTPIDQYAYDGQSGQWLPNAGVTTSYRTENALLIEDILQKTPEGRPLVSILFINDGGRLESLVVQSALPAISSLKDSILFLYIPGFSTYVTPAGGGLFISNQDRWLNRDYIVSTTQTSYVSQDGQALNQLLYRVGETQQVLFVSDATTAQLTGQDVVVEPQPATEFIFTNPLSLCYDITVVNHATGATNTIHTPLTAADYNNTQRRYIVPFGGFMIVFSSDVLSRTFIYFIDNDGNLVDQIDGAGPGYDWGEIDYRLVWAYDVEADLSVLKIFDGKNVRTHEFPYLAGFNMNPWSEGDSSKNLYVPFLVDDNAAAVTHLYISTPGGGLIDLDYDTWYDNEYWSTIHPTSDKIFRLTSSPGGRTLEVYSEDGVKINSLDLTSYNVNDDLDRNYYGANGDFVTAFYNFEDNTVPYLFLVYKAATNTFVTFTSETAVNGYSINYIDHETYDTNVSAANVLTLVIGVSSPSAINGMADWSAGSTIHWVPANGTSWQSFENNNGDAFSLSYDDGYFGTYPLFITTQDSIPGLAGENLYAILLGEESHALLSTGIAAADAVNVITSCLHDYTYARIETAGDPANVTQWIVYSDEVVNTASTSTNYDYRQEGGTIVVIDGSDSNNNWSWTTAAVNTVGDIIVPAATESFEIASNNSGGYWNPWGYSTNGKQVLIDKNGLDQVVGFYFLTEDSTAWTYMPNAWDDGTGRAWIKGLNNFVFMTWNTGLFAAGGYVYMNYDIATGAFISGGTSEILFGGNFGINAEGDRQSAVIELPVSGDYEHNCFTAAGIVKVTTPSSYAIAYNGAVWSWD